MRRFHRFGDIEILCTTLAPMSKEAPGSRRAALPRAVWIYFAAVAFTGIGFIAAFTVGTVAIFVITESRVEAVCAALTPPA